MEDVLEVLVGWFDVWKVAVLVLLWTGEEDVVVGLVVVISAVVGGLGSSSSMW